MTDPKSNPDLDMLRWLDENYPQIGEEFKKIILEQSILFAKKHRNYGVSNINVGTNLDSDDDVKLALTGLWFRMNDKMQRLRNLIINNEPDTVGESLEDTFKDLSIYAIIAQIVQKKKFKRG